MVTLKNTDFNKKVGWVLHEPQGRCISLENGSGVATDPTGMAIVYGSPSGGSTFNFAPDASLAKGFVAQETASNPFSRSIILFENGMKFVGKTGIDSGIKAGDLITIKDGFFLKATTGDFVMGECFEDGLNSEDGTYGTIPIIVNFSLIVGE